MSRLFVLFVMLMVPASAIAQDCTIAAYADAAGTQSGICAVEGEVFSIYVVIFTEDTVAAAAYSMEYPSGMFLQGRFSGPGGDGLAIDESTGTNVALTECVIGFGGHPVLVDEYLFVVFPGIGGGVVTLGANVSQDPDYPQYVTCNDIQKPCVPGELFYFGLPLIDCHGGVPTDATSFTTIKSLFNGD